MDSENKRYSVGIDFDGVIHDYKHGWRDGSIYGHPVPGAENAIRRLMIDYNVFVFTTREPTFVAHWMYERMGLPTCLPPGGLLQPPFWNVCDAILVTNQKLAAIAYIDDRAIRFIDWAQALNDLWYVTPLPNGTESEPHRRSEEIAETQQNSLF